MNKELFKQYADVKNEIKRLSDIAKGIELQVREEMIKEDKTKAEAEFGTFSLVTRKKYTYTDKVKEAEKSVKEMKKEEEKSGLATVEESQSITFRAK